MAAGSAGSRCPARKASRVAVSSHICTIRSTAISAMAPSMAVSPRHDGRLGAVMTPSRAPRLPPPTPCRPVAPEQPAAADAAVGPAIRARPRPRSSPRGKGTPGACRRLRGIRHARDGCISGCPGGKIFATHGGAHKPFKNQYFVTSVSVEGGDALAKIASCASSAARVARKAPGQGEGCPAPWSSRRARQDSGRPAIEPTIAYRIRDDEPIT